jgi:5-methylthioadenosine/S-adenosylhomocysteine deaminase
VNTLDPTVLDAGRVLKMATADGAAALGLGEMTGSLTPGKRADLVVVDTRRPHLVPMYHPVSHLVYAVRGGDVASTVIDGRVVMEDRKLLTLDLAQIGEAVSEIAGRIRSR